MEKEWLKIILEKKVVSLNILFLFIVLMDIVTTKIGLSRGLTEQNPLFYIVGEPVFLLKMLNAVCSIMMTTLSYFYLKAHRSKLIQLPFFCWIILIDMQLHAVLSNVIEMCRGVI